MNRLLLVAALFVNCITTGMIYWTIYGSPENNSSFFQDLSKNPDLYFVSFISPLILSFSCFAGLINPSHKGINSFLSFMPTFILVLLLVCNYMVSNGVGLIVLSSPFILASVVIVLKKQMERRSKRRLR